ncbi:MAG: hypothetical protein K8W52_45880 [Deltaproteobacteria bacterium]|nr:hypothetical protein [Deltaproteobacteria bacterium]
MAAVDIQLGPIQIARGELRVPYVVTNRGDVPVYIYNLVPDRFAQLGRKPDLCPSAQLAQTCYEPEGMARFILGQVRRPVVSGFQRSHYSEPKPLASRIPPGRSFPATIRAVLPLVEWSEIWVPQRAAAELVETPIRIVQVIVEYAREPDLTVKREDAKGAFAISETVRHRTSAEQDVAALGIRMGVHPLAPRFA